MPSIKVVTLNVGRGFPRCGIEKAYQFLSNDAWDILCIQDAWETDIEYFTELFPKAQVFAPMAKHQFGCKRVPVGIGIFSRHLPFKSKSVHAYVGNTDPVLDLEGVEVDAFNNASPKDLARVRKTESRLVIFVEFEKDGVYFKVATTHGPWAPAKETPDDHQRRSINHLVGIVEAEGHFVMAGDLNVPRLTRDDKIGELYKILFAESLRDCVPPTIKNSVDWDMRRCDPPGPDLLVDYVCTDPSDVYKISDVEATFGVSDHAALSATISRM